MFEHDKLFSRRHFVFSGLKTATGLLVAGTYGFAAADVIGRRAAEEEIFDFDPAMACNLTCSQTIGPCYAPNPLVRQDITSGLLGLPLRLAFRVVDTNCLPVSNASIDIWHANVNGIYSALAGFCANGDANAPSQNFLRGVQSTNADGWAYFNTIYPGWYPSRTNHIHATIRVGTTAMVTTQFYFPDRLNNHIFKNHPRYRHRPVPATTNTTDNILGGSLTRMMPYIFSTRAPGLKDMVAWKHIVISSSPTTCNA